jgi:hypothetical protein
VLWFTPEVEHAMGWFKWTHEPTENGWQRRELPRAGGLAKQDARLMLLLDIIRATANTFTAERMHERTKSTDLAEWRATRERERRGK